MNGETFPDSETADRLDKFIIEKSYIGDFRHIKSDVFADLLMRLMDEFKGEITQEKLARKIGKHQKDISNLIYQKTKASTRTQLDILRAFEKLCDCNGAASSRHWGVSVIIERYLYNRGIPEVLEKRLFGVSMPYGSFIQYFLTLNMKMQTLVHDYFDAFHDNLKQASPGISFDFTQLSHGIMLFRQLSEDNKENAFAMLQAESVIGFPKNDHEYAFFKKITAYRHVIAEIGESDYINTDFDKNSKLSTVYITELEGFVNLCEADEAQLIREVSFKLSLTQQEWYFWSLMLVYEFNGNNISSLCGQLSEMISTQND